MRHQAQGVIAGLLARPEVVLVHLRNVGYGCYNFCVRAHGGQETVKGGGS
jgi:hypothetical protein